MTAPPTPDDAAAPPAGTRGFSDRLLRPLRRTTSGGAVLAEIDGLRFVAIVGVMACHWPVAAPALVGTRAGGVLAYGRFGVPLFFAISGFILALPFVRHAVTGERRPSLRHYYLRRLTRLEPPFILSLLLFVTVQAARHATALTPGHVLASLTYTHNLVYGQMSWSNPMLWSLEVEVQFYLLLPLLMRLFGRPAATRWAVLGGLAIAAAAVRACVGETDTPLDNRLRLSIVSHGAYFVAGIALAEWYVRRPPVLRTWAADGWCVAAALLFPLASTRVGGLVMPPVVLAFFAGTLYGRGVRAVMANIWVATFGGMCYTIYLYHFPVLRNAPRVLDRLTPPGTAGLLLKGVAAGAITLALAVPLFLVLEKPFMRRDWTAAVGRGLRRLRTASRRTVRVAAGTALAAALAVTAASATAAAPPSGPARPPTTATAATTRPTAYATGRPAVLRLQVPADWQDLTRPPPNPAMPAVVRLSAREPGGPFAVELRFSAWPGPPTDEQLRDVADGVNAQYSVTSVEGPVDPRPIRGDRLAGFVATFTDARPNPGRYACVTTVTARIGDALLTATILHPKDSRELPRALNMLRTATFAAATTRPAAATLNAVRLPAPGGKWTLVLDLPGVEPFEPETRSDGRGTRMMSRTADGTIVSAFVEPSGSRGDARTARKFYWDSEKQAPLAYTDVKMTGDARLALLGFTTEGVGRNVHGYLVRGDWWIDVHLSKPDGTDADAAALLAAVRSARFETIDGN